MGKKLTSIEMKKKLTKLEKEELVDLILRLNKSSSAASAEINLRLGNESVLDEELEKTKKSVEKQFFTSRGYGRLDLAQAKKEIKAFDSICSDPKRRVDLKLSFVENAVEFTSQLGDINDRFYTAVEKMFDEAAGELANTKNAELIRSFLPRMDAIVEGSSGIGWGFEDGMSNILLDLEDWRESDEEDD